LQNNHAVAQSGFSGFVSNYNAWATTGENDLISGRNRVRLNYRNEMNSGRIYISSDLRHLYSERSDSLDFRLREAFIDVYFDNGDLRIGKQPVVWGHTEGDFILDIMSPFDLSEFITQNFDELREGVTAISYTHFFNRNQLQLIVSPLFEAPRLPDYEGRWGVVPSDFIPIPTKIRSYRNENPTISDIQAAARFAWRPTLSFDIDFVLMYWTPGTPGYFKQFEVIDLNVILIPTEVELRETFNATTIAGFWGSYRMDGGLTFRFESAWFENRPFDVFPAYLTDDDLQFLSDLADGNIGPGFDFTNLPGPVQRFDRAIRENRDSGFQTFRPALKSMIGAEYQFSSNRISAQYVADIILDYDEDIMQDEYFHGISASYQGSFLRDRLTSRLTGRYQFNGKDFWINPELSYDLRDGLVVRGGGHFFGGPIPRDTYTHLAFSRYRPNSLVYVSVAWFW